MPASLAPSSLDACRTAFIAGVRRETPGSDLPRYVAVLDALLAWAATHADRVVLSPSARQPRRIRFEHVGTRSPIWSVHAKRTGSPMLEIHIGSSPTPGAERRAEVMRTLNAHTRATLVDGDRLLIGFGALKNATALAAVLALIGRLLEDHDPVAAPKS